jgi:hypothetical protein
MLRINSATKNLATSLSLHEILRLRSATAQNDSTSQIHIDGLLLNKSEQKFLYCRGKACRVIAHNRMPSAGHDGYSAMRNNGSHPFCRLRCEDVALTTTHNQGRAPDLAYVLP